jgi:hypothetical protein
MFELLASYGIASFLGGGIILALIIWFLFFRG